MTKKNITYTCKLNPRDAVAHDVAPSSIIARLGTDDGFGYFKRDPLSKEAAVKFVYGPMAEKLYAYEQLGYSPEELKEIVDNYNAINIISNTLADMCRLEADKARKEAAICRHADNLEKFKKNKDCVWTREYMNAVYCGCCPNSAFNNKRVPYKYNKNCSCVVSTKG